MHTLQQQKENRRERRNNMVTPNAKGKTKRKNKTKKKSNENLLKRTVTDKKTGKKYTVT